MLGLNVVKVKISMFVCYRKREGNRQDLITMTMQQLER